jgi:hypothetical protein
MASLVDTDRGGQAVCASMASIAVARFCIVHPPIGAAGRPSVGTLHGCVIADDDHAQLKRRECSALRRGSLLIVIVASAALIRFNSSQCGRIRLIEDNTHKALTNDVCLGKRL